MILISYLSRLSGGRINGAWPILEDITVILLPLLFCQVDFKMKLTLSGRASVYQSFKNKLVPHYIHNSQKGVERREREGFIGFF